VSTRDRDVKDGKAEDATRQPEQVRAFRDTWELGIHSYLAYLRDRLVVARELLTESGSIFVQIGEENVHLVRSVLDEVFGADNALNLISFATTGGLATRTLSRIGDYVLWYARHASSVKYRQLYSDKPLRHGGGWAHARAQLEDGTRTNLGVEQVAEFLKAGRRIRPYSLDGLTSQGRSGSPTDDTFEFEGRRYHPGPNAHWKTTLSGMERLAAAQRIEASTNSIRFVRFLDDFPVQPLTSSWTDTNQAGYVEEKLYVVQTITRVIERCLLMATDPGDLALDPTCGSGTTAYVAEQWGRRWITIDTSRVALALARTRLMAARYPFYLLADSPDGRKKEADLTGDTAVLLGSTAHDIRQGFVYERVPHLTLKSIAQNPEIRVDMTRAEIDAAIARNADTERLFDRPYADAKVVRVSGPFTVESLSPHRVVANSAEDYALDPAPAPLEDSGRFVEMILDNLRASGVDNRVRGERIRFESLDPYAGTWLQAAGEYMEGDQTRRAAIAISPQYGTVGPELIREAAKEAARFFDTLIVCGFAFDALAGGESAKLGRLTVLQVHMNPDLSMGEDLLKKTRAGNMFTIFGQPDIDIRPAGDGLLQVEIRGLDVFDPTTGELRSQDTRDIACWFIDTAYNDEAFFVRHAYFTGADDPYDKLKRALRAEIDEAAWASLASTVSRPFPRPLNGKIAVKVINHYGDEILKVYAVS
jgi:adenine-specific DNA-methyltransferase